MRKLLVFVSIVAFIVAFSVKPVWAKKPIVIAVIDTGIDASNPHLCNSGHYDFVHNTSAGLGDAHGHGTHIAGLIAQEAGEGSYCIVSMKFYSEANSGLVNLRNEVRAIDYAINLKVDFINLSGGGPMFSEDEYLAVKRALKAGIKLVMAAGNEGDNLDVQCNYYPACYDSRIVMVGNMERIYPEWATDMGAGFVHKIFDMPELKRAPSSNYGKRVTRWEMGTMVKSTLPGKKTGYMSGTSQATAIVTGKLIRARLEKH